MFTYGLIKVIRPLALLLCVWTAKIEYVWCHSPILIPIVEIAVALIVSMCLLSSILYWIVSIAYLAPIIGLLYALFIARVVYKPCIWLMESNNWWFKKIGMISLGQYLIVEEWCEKVSSLPTTLLCQIAILALDYNCANPEVIKRCLQVHGNRNPTFLLHQLPSEQVFAAFHETILKKNNGIFLQQLQSIASRISIGNQNLHQLGFSLTLFATTFDHEKSIKIISEIESKNHTIPLHLQGFPEPAWQFPLDHAIKTAIMTDFSDEAQKSKFTFLKLLLEHFGIKALRKPHVTMEYALEYDAPIAKYLILNSTIRTWMPHNYKLFQSERFSPFWLQCCLSPTDIEELYDHQVDVRYLIRLTIRPRWQLLDGGQVLHHRFIKHKEITSLAQNCMHQFPKELVLLLMSYV